MYTSASSLCPDLKVYLFGRNKAADLFVTQVIFFFFPLLSHKSHRPAHGEDGGRRSRRRPRGDALLLQGEDGQPRSDPALHQGQWTLMDVTQSVILTLTLILQPRAIS